MTANKHRDVRGEDFRRELEERGRYRMPPAVRAACEVAADVSGDPLAAWPAFTAAVRDRLDAGRESYGDRSFGQSAPATLAELEQEALDLAGWGFVLWMRMRRMRHALERFEVDTARRLAGKEPAR